jgi:hypothetical protein
LCPDTLDKSKFKTKSEKDFLALIGATEKWLSKLTSNTMSLYEVAENE